MTGSNSPWLRFKGADTIRPVVRERVVEAPPITSVVICGLLGAGTPLLAFSTLD